MTRLTTRFTLPGSGTDPSVQRKSILPGIEYSKEYSTSILSGFLRVFYQDSKEHSTRNMASFNIGGDDQNDTRAGARVFTQKSRVNPLFTDSSTI